MLALIHGFFDAQAFGARPVKRAVQQHLETTIAKALLRGDFGEEDVVRVLPCFCLHSA